MSNCDCGLCGDDGGKKLVLAIALALKELTAITPMARPRIREALRNCIADSREQVAGMSGVPKAINTAYLDTLEALANGLDAMWSVVDEKFAEDFPKAAELMKELENAVSADTSKDA